MNSVLADTEIAWTTSWWPWKVWTQLPNKLSQTLTVPSAQPVAKYLEVPIQVTHVTPSCNWKAKKRRRASCYFIPISVLYIYLIRKTYTAWSQMNLGVECWRSQIISFLSIPPVAAIGMVAELGENFTHSTDSVWEVKELTTCVGMIMHKHKHNYCQLRWYR